MDVYSLHASLCADYNKAGVFLPCTHIKVLCEGEKERERKKKDIRKEEQQRLQTFNPRKKYDELSTQQSSIFSFFLLTKQGTEGDGYRFLKLFPGYK